MQPQHRLRARADFDRARRRGRSYGTPLLALNVARTDLDATRCGFAISKRVGTAVIRNRIRRRLREHLRARLAAIGPGWDLVVSARPAAATATFQELGEALDQLLRRARIVPT